MTEEILIKTTNLSYHYTNRLGVENINLQLQRGEILGLLGPNGAGKSSLLKLLSGLLRPTAGGIEILGQPLHHDTHRLRAHIGYQPDRNVLYPSLTIDENLRYALGFSRRGRTADWRERLEQTRQLCGLEKLGNRLVSSLSKGMLQRANLAQAIIHQPDIILLDEPTDGLDPLQVKVIRQLLQTLGKTSGIILSSHLLAEVGQTCTSLAVLKQGRLVYNGPAAALQNHARTELLKVRFETPPDIGQLRRLDGVSEVDARPDQSYLVHCRQRNSTTQAIIKLANQHNWHIAEITPQQQSLEELFTQALDAENQALQATDDSGNSTAARTPAAQRRQSR